MEKKIQEQIESLNQNIEWTELAVGHAVKEFKEAAAKYDAYNIDEFIDVYVNQIRVERRKLAQLQEQKRVLVSLLDSKED